jgi:large subunit ribosomal protein L34e
VLSKHPAHSFSPSYSFSIENNSYLVEQEATFINPSVLAKSIRLAAEKSKMVQGKFKSGRFRKVQRKVPGGQTKQHFRERKPKQATCGETGEKLHGIPRMSATEAKNAPKSEKRPQRPYGGALSSRAMRNRMQGDARALDVKSGEPKGKLFQPGRVCLKIAGRDAGKRCVIVDEKDGFFTIDGETRRRKVSVKHLEPLNQLLDVKKGASHEDVKKAFAALNLELVDTKAKKAAARPKRMPKKRAKPVVEKKLEKKAEKKAPAKESTPTTPAAKPAPKTEEAKPAQAAPAAKPASKPEAKKAE